MARQRVRRIVVDERIYVWRVRQADESFVSLYGHRLGEISYFENDIYGHDRSCVDLNILDDSFFEIRRLSQNVVSDRLKGTGGKGAVIRGR